MIRRTGNLLWRACRVVGGIVVLLAGLFLSLPGIPGPGIVVIVLGLGILSSEFDWADRLYIRLKEMGQKMSQNLLKRKNSPEPSSSLKEPQKGG
jgi:hypothetical protein